MVKDNPYITSSRATPSVFCMSQNVKITYRSCSLKTIDSGTKMTLESPRRIVLQKSLSIKQWEPSDEVKPENAISLENLKLDKKTEVMSCRKIRQNKKVPDLMPTKCPPSRFSLPRPKFELDAAAVKLQKVYKSYRTRRNLADCAVVVEELWWKALDFASLNSKSVTFFEKPRQQFLVGQGRDQRLPRLVRACPKMRKLRS